MTASEISSNGLPDGNDDMNIAAFLLFLPVMAGAPAFCGTALEAPVITMAQLGKRIE